MQEHERPDAARALHPVRLCVEADLPLVAAIINDAARAYAGVIPADCWHEPYMSYDELMAEVAAGVVFHGAIRHGELVGVMGLQDRHDVSLIRHAYVRTDCRRQGLGGCLLRFLEQGTSRPVLLGTWRAATWAIDFYQGHGYRVLPEETGERLLRRYWRIGDRQIETSVVLANRRFIDAG